MADQLPTPQPEDVDDSVAARLPKLRRILAWPHDKITALSTKVATRRFSTEAVIGLGDPMVGSLGVCCALAAGGHATALPSSAMNSRRFMSDLAPHSRSDHPATVGSLSHTHLLPSGWASPWGGPEFF